MQMWMDSIKSLGSKSDGPVVWYLDAIQSGKAQGLNSFAGKTFKVVISSFESNFEKSGKDFGGNSFDAIHHWF